MGIRDEESLAVYSSQDEEVHIPKAKVLENEPAPLTEISPDTSVPKLPPARAQPPATATQIAPEDVESGASSHAAEEEAITAPRKNKCCSIAYWKELWAYAKKIWNEPYTYSIFMFSLIGLFLNADQNLVAPNLTAIAVDLGLNLTTERDLYLGGYLTIGFFIVGGVTSLLIGALTDCYNRKNLFCFVVVAGETACFCTLFVTSFNGLMVTRAVTGMSIGGTLPLMFSMIGDMYDQQYRGKVSSIVSITLSIGIFIGQTAASTLGPMYGWRIPFVVIAIPSLILTPIYYFTGRDPPRGTKENIEGLEDAIFHEKMNCAKLVELLTNPSAVILFLQGIPGSLPWGVLMTYLQDFLVQDIGPQLEEPITVQQSLGVVTTFGVGAGLGLVVGGFIFDRLWKYKYEYVGVFMGCSTLLGMGPIYAILNSPPLKLWVYAIAILPSGILATMTGACIKPLLLNVTAPETRGTAMAFQTLTDDIGKGLGPLWVSLIIVATGGRRVPAFNYALMGWLACGGILLFLSCTVRRDKMLLDQRMNRLADKVKRTSELLALDETRAREGDGAPSAPEKRAHSEGEVPSAEQARISLT